MSDIHILPDNLSIKELDEKLNVLADLFFKENPFFLDKNYGNRTISQAVIDTWIIQNSELLAASAASIHVYDLLMYSSIFALVTTPAVLTA